MLWAAGARAVSLAFAAAGGSAGLFAGLSVGQHLDVPDVGGLPGPLLVGAGGAAIGVVVALVAMRLVVASASGATAAAVAAGLAVVLTPHLPADWLAEWTQPHATGQVEDSRLAGDAGRSTAGRPDAQEGQAFTQASGTLLGQAAGPGTGVLAMPVDPFAAPAPASAQDQGADGPAAGAEDRAGRQTVEALRAYALSAWRRVPEPIRGHALLGVIGFGLLGATLGAVWPGRIASATTAFLGAAIWPAGAIRIQALAGTPLPTESVGPQAWIVGWLALGIVGLMIQRLVLRQIARA
ncbi:MAG: hypothetical protein KatS3mg103_0532 [Phycisphaerales bacterium]|nr:MAG: hypothetical protein KatS3mg103_0532 [Phycisphaerales bacterium]